MHTNNKYYNTLHNVLLYKSNKTFVFFVEYLLTFRIFQSGSVIVFSMPEIILLSSAKQNIQVINI